MQQFAFMGNTGLRCNMCHMWRGCAPYLSRIALHLTTAWLPGWYCRIQYNTYRASSYLRFIGLHAP